MISACWALAAVYTANVTGYKVFPDMNNPYKLLITFTVMTVLVVLMESINALLHLFGIKDDWIGEILKKVKK